MAGRWETRRLWRPSVAPPIISPILLALIPLLDDIREKKMNKEEKQGLIIVLEPLNTPYNFELGAGDYGV